MNPPWSMIIFTTLAGAAQGLLVALVLLDLAGAAGPLPPALFVIGAAVVLLLSGASLVAASFHLGHPLRAWRAAAMWRTSWLSREVIVLPAFMAAVALWGAGHWMSRPLPEVTTMAGIAAVLLAALLYLCTGMIYGAIKAIPAWATPWTPVNFALMGLASGGLLALLLTALIAPQASTLLQMPVLVLTLLAIVTRVATRHSHARRVPKTTIQSAIGVRHPQVRQTSQGAMGGSFNSREFSHGRSTAQLRTVRRTALVAGGVLPVAALLIGGVHAASLALACAVQALGLVAERWTFFAEGQHTQNLYMRRD